jgi:hypothetical protein
MENIAAVQRNAETRHSAKGHCLMIDSSEQASLAHSRDFFGASFQLLSLVYSLSLSLSSERQPLALFTLPLLESGYR